MDPIPDFRWKISNAIAAGAPRKLTSPSTAPADCPMARRAHGVADLEHALLQRPELFAMAPLRKSS